MRTNTTTTTTITTTITVTVMLLSVAVVYGKTTEIYCRLDAGFIMYTKSNTNQKICNIFNIVIAKRMLLLLW